MDAATKDHWAHHHTQQQGAPIWFHGEGWRIFLGPKKISTNLKYHLLDHMARKAAKAYWAGKTCFWDIDINLVDWSTIGKVVQSQTISMHRWTTKFITRFCTTGCWMVQIKNGQLPIAPAVATPMKTPTTSYNAQIQICRHCGTPQS